MLDCVERAPCLNILSWCGKNNAKLRRVNRAKTLHTNNQGRETDSRFGAVIFLLFHFM